MHSGVLEQPRRDEKPLPTLKSFGMSRPCEELPFFEYGAEEIEVREIITSLYFPQLPPHSSHGS